MSDFATTIAEYLIDNPRQTLFLQGEGAIIQVKFALEADQAGSFGFSSTQSGRAQWQV